jgi:hypothetical protein
MSAKEDNGAKESKESDYEKDNDQLEVEQEVEGKTGKIDQATTTNQVF